MCMTSLIKQPCVWIPLAMSIAAFLLVIGTVTLFGVRQGDEGTAAHIFQSLLAGQIPLVACFAITWLPKKTERCFFNLSSSIYCWNSCFCSCFLSWIIKMIQ